MRVMTDKEKDAIEYKLVCYYHAKTELYDRTLTDLRSPHDQTEAVIIGYYNKRLSGLYAKQCHDYIREVGNYFGIKVNVNKYNKLPYSAQYWVDECCLLESAGEYEFMNTMKC